MTPQEKLISAAEAVARRVETLTKYVHVEWHCIDDEDLTEDRCETCSADKQIVTDVRTAISECRAVKPEPTITLTALRILLQPGWGAAVGEVSKGHPEFVKLLDQYPRQEAK